MTPSMTAEMTYSKVSGWNQSLTKMDSQKVSAQTEWSRTVCQLQKT